MPLGGSPYFNFPGAMGDYESALMELAGSQRQAGQMDFSDFLNQLTQALGMYTQRRQEKEQLEWQRGIRERQVGLGEERLEMEKPYYEARTEQLRRPEVPKTPFQLWMGQNPGKNVKEYLDLTRTETGGQPLAWERRMQIQAQNRTKYFNMIGTMFDERGIFTGTPAQLSELRTIEKDIGLPSYPTGYREKEETTVSEADITTKYSKYVAKWLEKTPTEKRRNPQISREEYGRAFRLGEQPTGDEGTTPGGTGAVPPAIAAHIKSFGTKSKAVATALEDLNRGDMTQSQYDDFIHWVNIYFGTRDISNIENIPTENSPGEMPGFVPTRQY